MKDFRGDLIRRAVLLDGFEVELYRLFRPIDELVGALRMGLASGEGGDGDDAVSVLVTLGEEFELGLHLSANLR